MKIINYPFENMHFNSNTKIMIDTCFLLSLLHDKDPKNTECILTLKKLIIGDCPLFINDIISAEFINQIIKKLFINDLRYKIDKKEPINTIPNINLILACFNKYDRKIIRDRKLEKFNHIPFNKYFYNISKNPWKKDLLKVYFEKSVEIHTQLEAGLKIRYVCIDEKCVQLAKNFMKIYMLSVNDAYHLACAELNKIKYLLTLDGDFEEISNSNINILKI